MAATIDGRARELLEDANFCHVSSLREDGSVHSILSWVDVDGDEILLNSAEGRAWPANLRRDPRVTLLVANRENQYEFASVAGRVVSETSDGAMDHADRLAKKYLGADKYPFAQPGEVRVVFRVEPDKVRVQGG